MRGAEKEEGAEGSGYRVRGSRLRVGISLVFSRQRHLAGPALGLRSGESEAGSRDRDEGRCLVRILSRSFKDKQWASRSRPSRHPDSERTLRRERQSGVLTSSPVPPSGARMKERGGSRVEAAGSKLPGSKQSNGEMAELAVTRSLQNL